MINYVQDLDAELRIMYGESNAPEKFKSIIKLK